MSQNKQILRYLQEGNTITPLEALIRFKCFRLGARIWDLKKKGYRIDSKIIADDDKHYSEYKLV